MLGSICPLLAVLFVQLKEHVSISFQQLQAAVVKSEEDKAKIAKETSAERHSFKNVHSLAFPLFLSNRQV
jgi:hypothetical protein